MVGPALRALAVAGVLIVTGVSGGVAAVPALAQPSDTDGSGQTSDDPTGGSEDSGDGEDTTDDPVDPVDPVDSGDPTEEPDQPEPSREPAPDEGGSGDYGIIDDPVTKSPAPRLRESPYENSITLPFIRLPSAGEIPMGSWPTVSTFYTTIEIPVPTLGEFLEALQIVPSPPPPGPAIRTQEEAPVADATTGTTGSGGGGAVSEPVIFRAPLVTVPRAGTIAGKPPRTAPGTPGVAAPPGVTAPGVAGVATPVIRGSVPSTPGMTAPPPAAAPAAGQSPRLGAYPRGVTNPTLAEIAAVALPGLAGLIFLTFSGGVIGYRQANSARFVRTAGAERFLP